METSDSIVPTVTNNPTQTIFIQQDNSAFPTSVILDETNYPLWSQLMEMCIGARNKAGYFTGQAKKPALEDSNLETWITENQRVKSWLVDSMSRHSCSISSVFQQQRRSGKPCRKLFMMDHKKLVFSNLTRDHFLLIKMVDLWQRTTMNLSLFFRK